MPDPQTRPILKWAGGKYRLLPRILPELPAGKRLVEPFVGSGAVFLNADYPEYLLGDDNADLIGFYEALRDGGQPFIEACRELFAGGNDAETYYLRREDFNRLPPGRRRGALFLYLNRHCFNGLVRYNAGGDFNVPFGRYKAPYFPEKEMAAFLARCASRKVVFLHADFRETFARIAPGDAVYCDPPYLPLSATANFTNYTGGGFGMEEQAALAALLKQAAASGAHAAVSNHDTAEARELYREATRVTAFPVRRSISCAADRRGKVEELLAVYEAE